jgi:hypothetical protein
VEKVQTYACVIHVGGGFVKVKYVETAVIIGAKRACEVTCPFGLQVAQEQAGKQFPNGGHNGE